MNKKYMRAIAVGLYIIIAGYFGYANFISSGSEHYRLDRSSNTSFIAENELLYGSQPKDLTITGYKKWHAKWQADIIAGQNDGDMSAPLCPSSNGLSFETGHDTCASSFPKVKDRGFPFATSAGYYVSPEYWVLYDTTANNSLAIALNAASFVAITAIFMYIVKRAGKPNIAIQPVTKFK